jgi:methyltransferase (TIGR00027 family)
MRESPSSTALFIARSLIYLRQHPTWSSLVSAHSVSLASACLHAHGINVRIWRLLCALPPARLVLHAAESALLPGIVVHYALRKKFIETATRTGIEAGIKQIVVLAAGYDALAVRLHRVRGLRCWELDHPASQAVKRRALDGQFGDSLRFLPIDLARTRLSDVLCADSGFDSSAPAIVVVEGFLMYLQPERVRGLLREIKALLAPGSRLIFTFMTPRPDGQIAFAGSSASIGRWLSLRGEPFTWAIPAAELSDFLADTGFTLVDIADDRRLRAPFRSRFPRLHSARGENIAIATPRMSHSA